MMLPSWGKCVRHFRCCENVCSADHPEYMSFKRRSVHVAEMIARDESSLMRPRRLPSRRDAFRAFYEATGNHHEVLWRLDRVRDAASLRSRIAQGQIVGRFEYPGKEDWRYVLLDEEGLPAAEVPTRLVKMLARKVEPTTLCRAISPC